MKKLLLALAVLLVANCTEKEKLTYFGGEIVNPKEDFVYLFFEEQLIDSASIDNNNRFHFQLVDAADGVYKFYHEREYQYIILEDGDSVMLRLNTLEFDESLMFTGVGAEKNNFLIDMWLLQEDEEILMQKFYKATPEVFLRKMDSMRTMKLDEYDELVGETDLSDLAKHITKATIDFPYYTTKEHYSGEHKFWLGLEKQPKLPSNFYEHRKTININDPSLANFGAYLDYLNIYLDHLTKDFCKNECAMNGKWSAYHYSTHRLNLVDSLVTLDNLRTSLMERTAFKYFQFEHGQESNDKFIRYYKDMNNGELSADLERLYNAIAHLRKGEQFPVIELYDKDGNKHRLDSSWYDQKTVFYLWTSDLQLHAKKTMHHMKKVAEAYPDFKFVSINLDAYHEQWKASMDELGVEGAQHMRAPDMKYIAKHFAYINLNRMVVVDENGKVIEGFGNIYNASPLKYYKAAEKVANAKKI